MQKLKHIFFQVVKLLLFCVFIFTFQQLLFSNHNWGKFENIALSERFSTFFYALRTNTIGALICLTLIIVDNWNSVRQTKKLFFIAPIHLEKPELLTKN